MRPPPPGLVDLRRALPGAAFDIRYATANNFTGAPVPGYEAPGAWLDADVAARVATAAADLQRDGLSLVVFDAYRPHRAARAMAAWCRANGMDWLLDGYLVEDSRHCRGIAIDVGLMDAHGARLDMGTDFDGFGPAGHTANATGEVLANRLRLRDAMLRAGMDDYRLEWWHFDAPDLQDARPLLDLPYAP